MSISNDNNVLLNPDIITDFPTQALLLTVLVRARSPLRDLSCDMFYFKFFTVIQATLVRNTTDENEMRILYEYLAEASVVFPKVFPVM